MLEHSQTVIKVHGTVCSFTVANIMAELKAQDQIEYEYLKASMQLSVEDPHNVAILDEIKLRIERRIKELEIRDLLKKEAAAFPAQISSSAKSTDDAMTT